MPQRRLVVFSIVPPDITFRRTSPQISFKLPRWREWLIKTRIQIYKREKVRKREKIIPFLKCAPGGNALLFPLKQLNSIIQIKVKSGHAVPHILCCNTVIESYPQGEIFGNQGGGKRNAESVIYFHLSVII